MKNILTKSVGVLLILLMLLSALAGCVNPEIDGGEQTGGENEAGENSGGDHGEKDENTDENPDNNIGDENNGESDNTEHIHSYEWVTDVEPTYTTPGVKHKECACGYKTEENTEIPALDAPEELNSEESELVATLIEYLHNLSVDHDMITKTLADKINDIKGGKQPLQVVIDPSSRYFVCAYYEGKIRDEYAMCFENAHKYVWVKYETIEEIPERYYDKNIVTIFQINRATYVKDILSDQSDGLIFEQFHMLRPLFGNETIIPDPYDLDEIEQSFIYLNSSEKDEVYFSWHQWNQQLVTIPCVDLDGDHYIYQPMYIIYHNENNERYNLDNTVYFEEYYDALMKVMITDRFAKENGYSTTYYGLIEIDAFVDVIRKENSNEEW